MRLVLTVKARLLHRHGADPAAAAARTGAGGPVIGKPVGPIVNSFKKMMNDTIMLSAGVTAMAGLNPSEFMTWLEPIVQLSSPMKKAACVSMPNKGFTCAWSRGTSAVHALVSSV